MSKVANDIRRGLEEALAYAEGKADAALYGVHVPETIDVKAIRTALNMSQQEFAGRFGFSVNAFSAGKALRLHVEALDATLPDLTDAWAAKGRPGHE